VVKKLERPEEPVIYIRKLTQAPDWGQRRGKRFRDFLFAGRIQGLWMKAWACDQAPSAGAHPIARGIAQAPRGGRRLGRFSFLTLRADLR
jgi:hypothetical protein